MMLSAGITWVYIYSVHDVHITLTTSPTPTHRTLVHAEFPQYFWPTEWQ